MLTLASGDRIPMLDTTKLMFENEHLDHASPATVSRAGIVYVSDTDLGWQPVVTAWVNKQAQEHRSPLDSLVFRYITAGGGRSTAPSDAPPPLLHLASSLSSTLSAGGAAPVYHSLFDFVNKSLKRVMPVSPIAAVSSLLRLLTALLRVAAPCLPSDSGEGGSPMALALERLFVYAVTWGVGGLLDASERGRWDTQLRRLGSDGGMPFLANRHDTVFDFFVDVRRPGCPWVRWTRPEWRLPSARARVNMLDVLVPTIDSARVVVVTGLVLDVAGSPVLVTGGQGTAKTSTVTMFLEARGNGDVVPMLPPTPQQQTPLQALQHQSSQLSFATAASRSTPSTSVYVKRVNFSNATTPAVFQASMDLDLEKRSGRTFGAHGGRAMTVFIDDLSMPEISKWGDQPTNELVRQLIEHHGYYFLDKDKRGDMKVRAHGVFGWRGGGSASHFASARCEGAMCRWCGAGD